MRQASVLGLLAFVLAAVSIVVVQARRTDEGVPAGSLLGGALGTPKPDAPLTRRPANGVAVRFDRSGLHVAGPSAKVSLRSVGTSAHRWTRYSHGVERNTPFGRETIVVTPHKTEQFLTVDHRQGTRTWRWHLASPGLTPRLGADGAVAFLGSHELAAMHIEPVAILDERGREITPAGLSWSVRGSTLELTLDDSKLPLPYVIDPAVSYRLAQVSNNGAAGAASITLTVPAGVVNNDLLFMHIAAGGGGQMTIATPAGWTLLQNTNAANALRLATFYRIASSEPASYAVPFGGTQPSQQAVGAITAYYGVKAITAPGPLDVNGATGTGNNAAPTATSINAAANALVIAAYSHGIGNGTVGSAMFTTAAGMAERYDAQSQNATAANRVSLAGDDILTAAGGATGAKAVTAGASGRWVAHQVSFVVDNVNPTSTTTFPAAAGTYNATGWAAGCASAGMCGTASDNDSSVQKVEVSIRQGAGNYWNGASFSSGTEVWNLATGTTAWSYGFSAFPADGSYTVRVQTTDTAANAVISSVTFTYDTTAPALATSLASSPVGPANNNSPAISGSAEAGSTVKLYTTGACTGVPTATGTAAAFASPGITVAVADDSSTTFKATATDASGNVSGCSSSSVTYVEDSTAPALPTSLASSPVGPANNNSPAISGTAEAGSTVKLYTTGACTGAPNATGTAAAFASPGIMASVSDDTSTTFKATATDAAGNVSGCSTSSVTYVEDSTAPALPTSLASSPVGPANNNSPAISGSAEAGSTVKLYTTGACTGAANATGTAAAFASPGITASVSDDTSTTFKATATDAAGNVSGCSSSSVTYVEDSTAPALPTSLASSPVGPANNNSPAISGTAEAGSTVKLYTTGACTGAPNATGTAAAFASPGITASVSDDTSTTFKATATDVAGNVSGCSSSSVTYVEDSTAPALPTSLASSPVGPANNNSPAISGTAEAGSTVKLYTTGACTGAPTATGTAAAFSSPGLTVAVSDDSATTFKATATDASGNVSGCSSSSVTYVEDSTAPALPTSLASSPVGPANNNSPAISGSAEAGSTVKLYTTGACTGAPNATGTATAFASPGITASVSDDTSTTFKATTMDAAGNVSGCSSSSVTYVEDSTAPALPTSLASSPVGPANNNSPAISGTAEAGSTVKLYTTGACTGVPTATGTAAAFASPGITAAVADDSSTTFKATATDAAGNVSGCSSSSVTYIEDSTAPALPTSLASSPVGPANNNSPAISGTAESGSTVKLYTTGACTGAPTATGTAAAFASPGITVAVSDDTSTTFKATATDAAGNVSGCSSSSATYVEDSTAPALPTSLASNPVGPANNNSPAISGTAEAGSTVKLYTTGACTGAPNATGTAAAFASPGITASVSDDTSTTFKATATDAAGNVSGCSSSSVTYVEDSTAPALPTSLASSPVGPANNNSPSISGSAEAGSTVNLYTTNDCSGSVAASGTAAAFASPGITVAVSDDSSTTFKGTATDVAGNVSNCSANSVTYVEDSSAPAAPSSLDSTPASPANDNSPKVYGTAEAGSSVKLYTTTDCSGSVAASGTAAAFSSPGLTVAVSDDSTTTFKATTTDAAGNVSSCSTGVTYMEDSTAPAEAASLASTPAGPANDNSPKISGTVEAGSTVKLYTTSDCSGSLAASGSAAAFGSPGLTVAVSDDSTTTFKATATDAAGNTSNCSASSVAYVEDSSPPAAPSSLASTPIGPANDNSPKISGTVEAGSTVKLYPTSDCSGSLAASGSAASFNSPGLTVVVSDDSTTTFKATTTDTSGNVSSCSAGVAYVEDSTAPALPTSFGSNPASPANDNSPLISGSAEAGSTVMLYATIDCSGPVEASGTAAAFSSPGLLVAVAEDTTTSFKATATDVAGNVSGCSSAYVYVEDSTAPAQPNGFGSTPAPPANDNAPKITGNADAGSTVKLYATNDCSGSVEASGTAAAFSSPGLPVAVADDSTTSFNATATDAAGNVSGCSGAYVYVEDSTAPAEPASLDSDPAGPANDNAPLISGSAEPGSTVELYTTIDCSGTLAASGTAAAFAGPGLAVTVADNSTTTFRATATDAAGNLSSCSASSVTYVENSNIPAIPSGLGSTPASPANDNAPKITGTADAGSTVELYATGDCSGAIVASDTAAAFASPGLAVIVADDSTTTYSATASNGPNVSACSPTVAYIEDSTAPAQPTGLGSTPASPVNDNAPKITGNADAGSTVKLYATNDCSGSVEGSGTAAAFSSPGLPVAVADDSTTSFKATATDAAGNVSGCSGAYVFIEDSTAPAQPTSFGSNPASPANDNSPLVSGSAEAGSTVKLYTTIDCSGSVEASGTAATFSSPGLAIAVADDSTTSFKATATDTAGNVSGCSSAYVYVEDSGVPAGPNSLGATPAGPANDNSPKISGNAEAGSNVKLYTTNDCSGAVAASGPAAAFGSPGLTVAVADDSTTTFKATSTDAAGNVSGCSTGITYVEDSTAPAAPASLDSTPGSPANDNAPAISGNAAASSTVKLYATTDCSGSVVASGTAAAFGSPGFTITVSDDSTTNLTATATDAVGNVSGCSSAYVYVEDSTTPSSTVGFPSPGGNYSPSGWNAGCATAGFCGTASDSPGSGLQKVEISIRSGTDNYYDGSSFSNAGELYLTAAGNTSWSYDFATSQFPVDGNYTIHVKATDNAGNVESFSSRTFVYDASAPTAPTLGFSAFTNASATGQTVYFRSSAAGGFTVSASASDPHSGISGYAFPALGSGWSGSQSGATYDYSFNGSAANPVEPNDVSAQNNAGLASSTSFTVTPDGLAPLTSIACDGGSCAGSWYTSSVAISLSASDGGSGLQEIRYTTDGSDPSPINGTVYGAPFSVGSTTTVKFRSYDSVGNEEAVGSQLVRIDDTAPSAPALTLSESPASPKQHVSGTTIFYNPQGGNSATFSVGATTTDAQSGIDTVSFPSLTGMTGGGDDFSSPYQGTYSWTASSSASGSQSVASINNAGLSTSSSFTVTPDTAPPSTGSVSYAGGYKSGSVTVTTADGTDPLSGVNAATGVLERDETVLVDGSCDSFTGAWSAVSSPDSTITSGHCYQYRYRVLDYVDNEAIYTSGNVVKVSTSAPGAPDLTVAETPGSPNQFASGTTLFYGPIGGNTGTFTVTANVTDSGGSGVDKVTFPSLSGMTGGGDDTTSPYQAIYDWTAGSSTSGAQTVSVVNNAGFTSQATFTLTVDAAPPTGQDASIAGGYYTSLSVPVTLQDGTDALSGVDPASGIVERESGTLSNGTCAWGGTWSPVTLSGGADTTVASNNCYRYRYVISDRVGNQALASPASLAAKVDATTPVTSDDAPGGWQNSAVTVTLSVNETGSGVASTVYRVDGSAFQGGTSVAIPAPANHSNDGVHAIEYRSTDNAGNVETLRTATVRIDTTIPTTTDDASAGWSTVAVTVTLSPADALSGIAATQYRVDGGAFQGGTSVSIPAPADHSNDGAHSVEYRSTDNAGNVEPLQTATVRIDTTLPAGALTAPANGAHVNAAVAISASASDLPSGVASVEFLVRPNGAGSFTSISTDTSAPYDASWDSTGAPEGSSDLKVVVLDNAGLSVSSAISTVVVDNPPVPTLGDPGANVSGTVTLTSTSPADTMQVVFERSPAGAGIWSPIATDTTAPFSADLDTSPLLDGSYDLRVVATDGGGFNGTSSLHTTRVDNTVPTVSLSDPANGAIVGGANIHVAALAADLGSGVASVRFEQRPAGGGSFTTIGTDTTGPYEASWDATGVTGSYELRAVATDAAGNPATAVTVTVTVEASAASVTLADPGSLLRGVVNLSASAPSAAVASVSFERRRAGGSWTRIVLDTARPWSASFNTRGVADGLYDLRAQALGSGGQVLATHSRAGITIDNTAPTLVSATPADGSVVSPVTSIALVASEPISAVQRATLDGSAVAAQISGSTLTFSTSSLDAGTHVLTGTLVDAAGNSGVFSVHFTVKVKAQAPLTLRVGKPKTRTQSNGAECAFRVSISLSGPARVRATLVSPTGRPLRKLTTNLSAGRHSLRFVLPSASLPPGRYTILVVATGSDGSRLVKRAHVTIAVKKATAPKPPEREIAPQEVVFPVAPASGSDGGDVSAPPEAPTPPAHANMSQPKKQAPHAKGGALETSSDYVSNSKPGHTVALVLVLLVLGAMIAWLIKIEMGRMLKPRR